VRIPKADRAVIDPPKLRDYLLSPSHPLGRYKAQFFRALGYSQGDWPRLDRDLRFQHLSAPVSSTLESPYGTVYEIRAMLKGPVGVSAGLVSIWMIKRGDDVPRLVTAYPGGPS
jgi:hypothetical protein